MLVKWQSAGGRTSPARSRDLGCPTPQPTAIEDIGEKSALSNPCDALEWLGVGMSQLHLLQIPEKGKKSYPLPQDLRMPTHCFIAWWHNRWLNSTLHLTGSYAVQGVALALYCIAQNQSPIGTLPADDVSLARLLRIDLAHWQDLPRGAVSPLYGYTWPTVRAKFAQGQSGQPPRHGSYG